MGTNQNETGRFSLSHTLRQRVFRAPRVSRCDTATNSPLAARHSPLAFTLTELLVVITIIAILASLVTAAAINSLNKGKQTRITLELQQIAGSLEEFKNEFGAYPPNGASPNGMQDFAGTPIVDLHTADFVRMFKKAFPRHQEPPSLIEGLAGGNGGNSPTALPEGMNGAEAIVFWLGGFSDDPQRPLSGPGGPSFVPANETEDLEGRNYRFDFELTRFGPRDTDKLFDTDEDGDGGQGRFITYEFPLGSGTIRRINLWRYTPAGSEQPYGYFDASRYRCMAESSPNTFVTNYDPWFGKISPTEALYAIKRVNSSNPNRVEFASQEKFQVLHAGIDDAWGNFSMLSLIESSGNPITFPEGPFVGDIADTCTNFTTGTLGEEQE